MLCIRSLPRGLDRTSFECGNTQLNDYFCHYVSQDIKRRLCACFVMMDDENDEVMGFYTLTPFSLEGYRASHIDTGNRQRIPVYLLGKLAVSTKFQGQGYAKELLANAVMRCCQSEIPSRGLIVHPKTADLIPFYEHHGFQNLGDDILFLEFKPKRSI